MGECNKKTYKELFGEIIKFNTQNIVFTPNPEFLLKTLEDVTKVESQRTFREDLLKKFPKLDFDYFIYYG
ncbi:MAG: hypothetical protein Q9M94_00910 [Candidatus Gracilibacteria bacterium]|nr:hypothetical protein [Candidatus Gracilibacteria bacterium]